MVARLLARINGLAWGTTRHCSNPQATSSTTPCRCRTSSPWCSRSSTSSPAVDIASARSRSAVASERRSPRALGLRSPNLQTELRSPAAMATRGSCSWSHTQWSRRSCFSSRSVTPRVSMADPASAVATKRGARSFTRPPRGTATPLEPSRQSQASRPDVLCSSPSLAPDVGSSSEASPSFWSNTPRNTGARTAEQSTQSRASTQV